MTNPIESLQARRDDIDAKLQTEREGFQAELSGLEGRNFGSLKANQTVADLAQEIADRIRVAFKCVKCGSPSRIHCYKGASISTGAFMFRHGKNTHGGTTVIPKLTLMDLPKRKKGTKKST